MFFKKGLGSSLSSSILAHHRVEVKKRKRGPDYIKEREDHYMQSVEYSPYFSHYLKFHLKWVFISAVATKCWRILEQLWD
jgi:hypothetical protein